MERGFGGSRSFSMAAEQRVVGAGALAAGRALEERREEQGLGGVR